MPETEQTLDRMAADIFELYQLVAMARSRRPSAPEELSETEFVVLDILKREQPLTIGEVQKRIGVLPAQMSRLVRSLEAEGGRGCLECKINTRDRRRIDVSLTETGDAAHGAYRDARLSSHASPT